MNPIIQMNHLDKDQKNYILENLHAVNKVLGVFRLQGCPLAPDVDALIQKREQARVSKDWRQLIRHGQNWLKRALSSLIQSMDLYGKDQLILSNIQISVLFINI